MKTAVIVIFAVQLTLVTCAVERYNLNMGGGREDSPWPALPCYEKKLIDSSPNCHDEFIVQMSRHHIIPLNILVAFWNNLILNEQHLGAGMQVAWSSFIIQYRKFPTYDKDVEDLITKIKNQLIVHDPNEQYPGDFDLLKQAWEWFGANLMVGPRVRSDDPGSGFEVHAYVIVGDTQFGYSQNVYNFMRTYNPETTDIKDVKKMASEFANVLSRSKPYPLVASNWGLKNGKYYINTKSVSVEELMEEIEESDRMEENENFVHPDL